MTVTGVPAADRVWLSDQDCDLDAFIATLETRTDPDDYPHASGVDSGVPSYDSAALRAATAAGADRRQVQAELVRALSTGPGIVVLAAAFEPEVIDRATDVFDAMVAEQRAAGAQVGDHFAKPGANDRIWNALEKLAVRDPATFVDYYANDMVALASESWLGPGYQVTSAINVVNPGGEAQNPHRDYHLGFMDGARAARFPAHVHALSPALTLQGAVAHCDMPVESGPTMYLPYSQRYLQGYLAFNRPEFRAYFLANHVQLPLRKGDAVFFNPALFHGAGHNRSTGIRRMANLLQVSSAFGRALEAVDRARTCKAIYPELLRLADSGLPLAALENAIAAAAEGYAFPTNLDRDPPVDGPTPPAQADLVRRAVHERWDPSRFGKALDDHTNRRATS